jgi:hypothetical protein
MEKTAPPEIMVAVVPCPWCRPREKVRVKLGTAPKPGITTAGMAPADSSLAKSPRTPCMFYSLCRWQRPVIAGLHVSAPGKRPFRSAREVARPASAGSRKRQSCWRVNLLRLLRRRSASTNHLSTPQADRRPAHNAMPQIRGNRKPEIVAASPCRGQGSGRKVQGGKGDIIFHARGNPEPVGCIHAVSSGAFGLFAPGFWPRHGSSVRTSRAFAGPL